MTKTRKVAILGATGAVGQRFLSLLDGHPTFRVAELVASDRSAGKRYADACRWVLNEEMPREAADLPVRQATDDLDADVVFSALPSGTAGPLESELAKRGYAVFSNAKDHRMDPDVPLLIPEVNPDHLALVETQPTDGFIVTDPNCSACVLTMTLAPLAPLGLRSLVVTTFQALSGAGYPGVPSLDSVANVVPFIGNEEPKIESEPQRMLGKLGPDGRVVAADLAISATATRVPVEEGHSMAVNLKLDRRVDASEIVAAWNGYRSRPQELSLPLAPRQPVVYRTEENRPQPRKDWPRERGMAVSVGRLRPDPILGWKYFASGSNTVRGAAGGSILNAELAIAEGYL
ncbi:MAG TPA: aspartate-semialdehyde dehydrogenase [Candidatus Thermoplasmatota archaeon]|nr:aspartate-semialdehyde dehydrogenase [Candidatus Thermoplasmatota archaeon]